MPARHLTVGIVAVKRKLNNPWVDFEWLPRRSCPACRRHPSGRALAPRGASSAGISVPPNSPSTPVRPRTIATISPRAVPRSGWLCARVRTAPGASRARPSIPMRARPSSTSSPTRSRRCPCRTRWPWNCRPSSTPTTSTSPSSSASVTARTPCRAGLRHRPSRARRAGEAVVRRAVPPPQGEGFLSRWSRLKREPDPVPVPAEPAPPAEAALPEGKTVEDLIAELPKLEELVPGQSLAAFMQPWVPIRSATPRFSACGTSTRRSATMSARRSTTPMTTTRRERARIRPHRDDQGHGPRGGRPLRQGASTRTSR